MSGRSPQVSPPGFARPSDRRGAPDLLARLRVVRGDKADVVLVSLAAGDAGDDHAFHDDRSARIRVALLRVRHVMVPGDRTGSRVERNRDAHQQWPSYCPCRRKWRACASPTLRIGSPPDALGLNSQSRSPVAASSVCTPPPGLGTYIIPLATSGFGWLKPGFQSPRPRELKLLHIASVDLRERAVAPAVEEFGASSGQSAGSG